jgi:small GTP-binding protein
VVFLVYDSLNTSIDELGDSVLVEVNAWNKIALTFDAIFCFIYTEWNYPSGVSEAVTNLFPNIVDLMTIERIIGTQVLTVSKNEGSVVVKRMIPIKKAILGGVKGYIPKVLVTGPFHAGKTTLVHTLSSRAVSVQRMGTTVALDFGHVDHRGFTLDLFGTVGQPRFDPILKSLGAESLGALLVVDSTKPEEFSRAKEMMQKAGVYGLPCVVVANKQDLPGALSVEEVRKKMNISEEIAIIGTVGSDKDSVLKALDKLIDRILTQ